MKVEDAWNKIRSQAELTSNEINIYLSSGLPIIATTKINKFEREYNKLIKAMNEFDTTFNVPIKSVKFKLPFEEPEFIKLWKYWKDYLLESFSISYKSRREQKALEYLDDISGHDVTRASNYLNYAMANGYRNFFKVSEKTKSRPAQNNTNRDGDF